MSKSELAWHRYFLDMTTHVSSKSKDRSTKVGALIVDDDHNIISTGYNNFPRGLNDDLDYRHMRPQKYDYVVHAEENSILIAARTGSATKDCDMYVSYVDGICCECAKAIIQCGIKRVIGYKNRVFPGVGKHYGNSTKVAKEMFDEVGIEIIHIPVGKIKFK